MPGARVGDLAAGEDLLDDMVLLLHDLARDLEDALLVALGDHDDPVVIPHHQVARSHLSVAKRYSHLDVRDLDAVFPGPHEAARAVDRVPQIECLRHVAADPVNRRSSDATVVPWR